MSEADLFSGAKVIISIKANYEIRDETGFNVLEKTKGELVLTEKEFVFLEVRPSNLAARSLYEKIGFTMLGLRRGYYRNPSEDAIVMGKSLSQ